MNRKQLLGRAVGMSLTLSLLAAPYVAPADVMPAAVSWSVAEAAESVGAEDVVLVGTVQTKFGAGTDWAPADGKTKMKPVGKGMYEYKGKLPKGNYEYKIAIGGSWGENYGADGARGLRRHDRQRTYQRYRRSLQRRHQRRNRQSLQNRRSRRHQRR